MSQASQESVKVLCKRIMHRMKHCYGEGKELCDECERHFFELNTAISKKAVPVRQLKDGLKRVYQLGKEHTLSVGEIFASGGFNNVWAGKLKSTKKVPTSAVKEYSRDRGVKESVVVKAGIQSENTPCLFLDYVITKVLDHPMILQPQLPLLSLPINSGRQSRTTIVYPRLDNDLHHILESESFTDHTVFQIFLQICSCLEDLQKKYQFMHRDLKPTNILYRYNRSPKRLTVSGVTFEECHIEPYIIDMGMASVCVDKTRIANDIMVADPTFKPNQDIVFYTANLLVDFNDVLKKKTPDFYAFLVRLYSQDELLFEELQCMSDSEILSSSGSSVESDHTSSKRALDVEDKEDDLAVSSSLLSPPPPPPPAASSEASPSSYSSSTSFSSSSSTSSFSERFSSSNNTMDFKMMRRLYKLSTESDRLTNFEPSTAIRMAKEDYQSFLADLRAFGVSSRKIKANLPEELESAFDDLNLNSANSHETPL